MRLRSLQIIYFYDGLPTLFACHDENDQDYFFCLLNEDKDLYIGIKVSHDDALAFLGKKIDLRTLFEKAAGEFYSLVFDSYTELNASRYTGEVTEEIFPAPELMAP